ncbi:MAG: isoprenyl transferase [Eubacteriaceae bacterium]|nr:isoprenyl transferase [Eubacteriaceae bacterium]
MNMKEWVQKENLHRHIAMIMDGNGRWAKRKRRPRLFGHRAGVETFKKIVRICSDMGIQVLTVYAFSTENWKRSEEEVSGLMSLALTYLKKYVAELHENNVVLKIIGDISKLNATLQKEILRSEAMTAQNTGMILQIALNYGGREELINAVKNMMLDGLKGSEITEKTLNGYLYTKNVPDPDMMIRTGGEKRLSNFLLWQNAYTEFFFTETLWPDFSKKELEEMIEAYTQRERRYGGIQ